MAHKIRSIRELDLKGKAVFIRVDFNVPLSEPDADGTRKVLDNNRIKETLPTLKLAMEKGAKLVLASHLGRPKGKKAPEFSLEPVAHELASLLDQEVTLADDCVGEGIEMMIKSLPHGEILLLENLRFHGEEEANSEKFCNDLARLTDVYINDAFGACHRKHASVYGLPKLMESRAMGLLIEKELQFLDPLLNAPKKPFFTILGGAKVSDKIATIEALLRHIDGLLIGGAMAYAFEAAQGKEVPTQAKQPTDADINAAKSILRKAQKKDLTVLLPSDSIDCFDIGPKTVEAFSNAVAKAKTVFWNGPLGFFEKPEYAKGTFALAEAISKLDAIKIIGGGDTVSAVKQSGFAENFDHLSTGGGAVLTYLEGNGLPGIDVLLSKIPQELPVEE